MGKFLGVFVLSWLFYSLLKNKIFSNTRTKLLSKSLKKKKKKDAGHVKGTPF